MLTKKLRLAHIHHLQLGTEKYDMQRYRFSGFLIILQNANLLQIYKF